MRSEYYYQLALISLGVVATVFFGAFFYREIFPEYKTYQDIYWDLEKLRSESSGKPPPPFTFGIKQIVFEKEDKGNPTIDRCTSCHLALEYKHFSPTSEDYVWKMVDEKILAYEKEGKIKEAEKLKALKTVTVGENTYDVTKVLRMHPLIGKETRPFEYHPMEEYGCTSCHNGNGRGLTTMNAHGPVFDDQYEEEFLGPMPVFTESDPKNDPLFAKVFNHKPGHSLLFQTTPIYVGGLIDAKCVQCHLQKSGELGLKHFDRGEELFVAQACYACHRVDGISRGGVGPELTNAGSRYPWYLKEKMVWPQGDLRTSTMPNYRLDHPELEDLMTFMLAQNGRGKSRSETDYRKKIMKWDGGEKVEIEKPINPAMLHDLRHSMIIFATEGCAACHRLKGFESNAGYSAVKKNDNFDTRYNETQWFKKLFPETIVGSEIVKVIEDNASEIDQRIVDNVRENSILEEIESQYPQLIESYYTPFRYASRTKQNDKAWTERIRRVLMTFIQEYGLGRIVGPRPNWSGVYRSDEWLIEHFRKPSRHIARSIMPAFPFDDSKFYALTYMLDTLGKKNRDEVREIWEKKGFSPEVAYQTYCSQCHGEYLHGDGPVAQWIYPIPKNLRNADFLRNFTKENVINSIIHGVKGTPMPPWGEAATDKATADGIPVISEKEIKQLVDWLFSSLLGGEVIKSSKDVPKWQYSPQEALKEMKLEKGELKSGPPPEFFELKEAKSKVGMLNAAEEAPKTLDDEVEETFDIAPNTLGGSDKNVYYFKKKYFTEENIKAGQSFFELNCSVCHGIEADGTGYRAGTMFDAKPRMLTNLHWIDSKDDLRLLRSIKYGVPGTAMIPWGDQTTSLQRAQLVIFIRSLSESQDERDKLFNALYEKFDRADQTIDDARVAGYAILNKYQQQITDLKMRQETASTTQEKLDLYKEELNLLPLLKTQQEDDKLLVELKKTVKEEGYIYQVIGIVLIGKSFVENPLRILLDLISSDSITYFMKDGKLDATYDPKKEEKIEALADQITLNLPDKLKFEIQKGFNEAKQLREKQRTIFKELTHDKV